MPHSKCASIPELYGFLVDIRAGADLDLSTANSAPSRASNKDDVELNRCVYIVTARWWLYLKVKGEEQ